MGCPTHRYWRALGNYRPKGLQQKWFFILVSVGSFQASANFPSLRSRHHADPPCRDGISQLGGDFFEERARQQAIGHAFQIAGLR